MKQYYRVADLVIEMDSFGHTVIQAIPYEIEGKHTPDIVIKTDWQSLKESQPHLSEEDCEYLSTGSSFYRQLVEFDGLMLHSSAVVMDGRAYLFSAPCGTGKSTHTALWRSVFGEDRAFILNDDKPAIRLENGEFFAYGTPWSGKTDQNVNMRVPIGGICVLRRGETNKIEPCGGSAAVFAILEQTARSKAPEFMNKLMDLIVLLVEKVPVWRMECKMDPEAAIMSYTAMSGVGKEK